MVSALARVRRSLGTTQTEVADALGVGQPAVSNLERRHDPKVSTLAAWAAALGGRLRITLDVDGAEFDLPISALGPRAEPKRRSPRRMRVIWQDAERQLRHVGNLTDDGVRYEFAYTGREETAAIEPFEPFPEKEKIYSSERLWSFFNDRPAATLGVLLGDESRPLPMVELEGDPATAGGKLQLIPAPDLSTTGDTWQFLASGVSHADDDAEAVLHQLEPGDTLQLHKDFNYPHPTSHARRLKAHGTTLGWLPDYAIHDVDRLEDEGRRLRVEVVRVQPPGGNQHLRLLCRLIVDG